MRLSIPLRIALYSALLCWGVQCDHERPATQYQAESGAILIAAVIPDGSMGSAAAKAVILQGRVRVSGTGMASRDTLLTVQGGRLQARLDGIPVGVRTVALVLLENSGDTLWQAAAEVQVLADETVPAVLVLERVGDLPPQVEFSAAPTLGGVRTAFSLQAQVTDLHDPTDSLQVRWDFDNDGRFEVDWTVAKDTSCVFGAAGNYRIVLEARDRGGKTGSITKPVQVVELLAQTGRNPGPDTLRVPAAEAAITLDGSVSQGIEGQGLTYHWDQVLDYPGAKDVSVLGTLTDNHSARASRVSFAPKVGRGLYVFTLRVEAGGIQSDLDTLFVFVHSAPPIATVEAPAPVEAGQSLVLQGRATDADDAALQYRWRGERVDLLSDTTSATPAFHPDTAGVYRYQFVAVDSDPQESVPAEVAVSVSRPNTPPVAVAGEDLKGVVGTEVTLDGRGSSDADGEGLRYAWAQTSGPVIALANAQTATPAFVPGEAGVYRFSLTVSDAKSSSTPDEVVVIVTQQAGEAIGAENIGEVQTVVSTVLASSMAKGPGIHPGAYSGQVQIALVSAKPVQAGVSRRYSLEFENYSEDGKVILDGAVRSEVAGADTTYSGDLSLFGQYSGEVKVAVSVSKEVTTGTFTVGDAVYPVAQAPNQAPLAQAGPDQTMEVGQVVQLDGSGSSDADGDTLHYRWAAPSGISLSSATVARPTFTASTAGTYRFTLVVNDGKVDSAPDEVVITVAKPNTAPVARAGVDQKVDVGEVVQLDGSGSTDAEGDTLSYRWTAPSGISLSSATVVRPTFAVSVAGTYRFVLVVNDGQANSAPDTVVVTAVQPNRMPVAKAGADQAVDIGTTVQLDGSGSSDADGDTLSYRWTAPSGISLSSTTVVRPTFTASVVGSYHLVLVVNDGWVDSAPDTGVITVTNPPPDNTSSGSTLSGIGTATIDGLLSAGEWAGADSVGFLVNIPGGGTTPATLLVMNDANNLYLALRFERNGVDPGNTLEFNFDANNTNEADGGDDLIAYLPDIRTFSDGYRRSEGNAQSDFEAGGTTDGSGAFRNDGTFGVYEISRPLHSGDSWDFSLQVGQEIGFSLSLRMIGPGGQWPQDFGDTTFPGPGISRFGRILITESKSTGGTANRVPVAKAGQDQTVEAGTTVQLDGSGSSDPDGEVLTYKWVAPSEISLSTATIAGPMFTATVAGTYRFTLVVNDGQVDSAPDTVVVTVVQPNIPPVANAGADQAVAVGATEQLDGSGSSDADGDSLRYKWTAPAQISLSSATAVRPTFTASAVGSYLLVLVVNDGKVDSAPDTVVIDAMRPNRAPVADAGPDQTVEVGQVVRLSGSGSKDPDPGDTLSFLWTPPSGITLNNRTAVQPTFTAATAGSYRFVLVVSDGKEDSAPDTVVIAAVWPDRAPVADAGPDQTVEVGVQVQLDGSGSSDPEGDALNYRWTVPSGISLSSTTVSRPTFTGSVAGTYRFSLVVNDGKVDSAPDEVEIVVSSTGSSADTDPPWWQTPLPSDAVVLYRQTFESLAPGTPPDGWSSSSSITAVSSPVSIGSRAAQVTGNLPYTSYRLATAYTSGTIIMEGAIKADPGGNCGFMADLGFYPLGEDGFNAVWWGSDRAWHSYSVSGGLNTFSTTLGGWHKVKVTIHLGATPTYDLDFDGGRIVSGAIYGYGAGGTSSFLGVSLQGGYGGPNYVDDLRVVYQPDRSPASTEKALTATLPGGATMEFVWIEPGTFTMGTTEEQEQLLRGKGLWLGGFENEHPAHQVTISKGFYLGQYEVTQGQWQAVMGTSPWSGEDYVQENPNNPAVYISWDDIQALVHQLNQAAGDSLYRLPTEAEWEYACRAGTTTLWSFGDEEHRLGEYAWYDEVEYGQPVGTKLPNPWGLYDMYGNVWEWVQDWYESYSSSSQIDPTGPSSDSGRVLRGGFLSFGIEYSRSASRDAIKPDPDARAFFIGTRLLRMAEPVAMNTPPEADAGPDQTVEVGAGVQLDGSGSSDPEGDVLSYQWSAPAGISLSSATVARPTFTASGAGTYHFSLVVSNGKEDSVPDTVVIEVSSQNTNPTDETLTVTTPVGTYHEMVPVPAGEFTMGRDGAGNEQPEHTVYLDGFYIDKYEVTIAQWNAYRPSTSQLGEHPVGYVFDIGWYDAYDYCHWAGLRLPTEAEWEKAARGTDGRTYPWGEGIDRNKANYGKEPNGGYDASDGYALTAPVGSYPAGVSPYGVYDMAGNVWEWVADWYDQEYYWQSPSRNPPGPSSGSEKVARGGSFDLPPEFLRAAFRRGLCPECWPSGGVGFRCARDQEVTTVEAPVPASQAPASQAPASTEKTLTVILPGGGTMEFVWIEPGTFTMGITAEQERLLQSMGWWTEWIAEERPAHQVMISQGFYLGKYEITQTQWGSVMGSNPSFNKSSDQPVETISWYSVQEFIHRLNQAAEDSLYRLPTEAEWEYACRAGTSSLWSFGDDKSQLKEYAWYESSACNTGICDTHQVGTRLPNPWGLFDMHGNVFEWCQDGYGAYTRGNQVDPWGPSDGLARVLRGGASVYGAQSTRSGFRFNSNPDFNSSAFGARLVRLK